MNYLCVGLSRTGTLSLSEAFKTLGFTVLHWAPERLRDVVLGQNDSPSFRRYDDVEVVTDLPAAYFHRELKEAYPDCRIVLTVRDIDSWYKSVRWHYEHAVPRNLKHDPDSLQEARTTQKYVYGSDVVREFLYKKKFLDFNASVKALYPDLLEMNIIGGDGWDKLCPFLGKPIPSVPFPVANQRRQLL